MLKEIILEEGFNKQKPAHPEWTKGKESRLGLMPNNSDKKDEKLCIWLTSDWTIAPHVAKIRDVLAVYKLFLWPSESVDIQGESGQSGFNNRDGEVCWQLQPTFFAKEAQGKLSTIFFGFGGEVGRPKPEDIYSQQMNLLSSLRLLLKKKEINEEVRSCAVFPICTANPSTT